MDPVSTALIAAVVAGATAGLNEVSKTAIGEAYGALKEKLLQRFGSHHALVQAVEGMERRPTSEGRQNIVVEEVQEAGADQDEELLGLAERVLTVVKPQQAGMGKYTIQNTGTVQGQTIGERVPVDVFLSALTDSQWRVQWAAVEAVKAQAERVSVEASLRLLTDSAGSVRAAVVRALGALGDRVPVDIFLGALTDSNDSVRQAALEALRAQGEHVPMDIFLVELADNDHIVRKTAVEALGARGKHVPMDVFLGVLADSHPLVRMEGVYALKAQGDHVPVDVFLGVLADSDYFVRAAAVEALEAQGERVPMDVFLGALTDSAGSVRAAAVEALEAQGERVPMDVFLGALADSQWRVRAAAVKVLKKRAPEALEPIATEAIAILQKQPPGLIFDSLIQGSFLDVIKSTRYTAPAVLTKVSELLDWPYWEVRMQAAETLGELRRNIPDAAIRRLLALRRDLDPSMKSVREAANDALAEILSLEDGIEDD